MDYTLEINNLSLKKNKYIYTPEKIESKYVKLAQFSVSLDIR